MRPPAAVRGQVPEQTHGPQTESPPKNKKLENKKGSRCKTNLGSVQVLCQQVFQNFGPPPLRQRYQHRLRPFYATFYILKHAFC